MPSESKEDKTEQPTSKKLEDARKKGRVPRSQEVNSALILLTGITVLTYSGPWILNRLQNIMRDVFTLSAHLELTQTNFFAMMIDLGLETMIIIAPMMLIIMFVGIAATLFQGGFVLSGEPLKPDISKLSPAKGFKRLFSLRSIVTLITSLVKVAPIAWIVYAIIKKEMPVFLNMQQMSIYNIMYKIAAVARTISNRVCILLIVVAAVDYIYQKWQFNDEMKMSKQEVKDELKNTEGDPRIKRHIRKLQYEVSMRRMMAQVPEADVVITNPTHLAVAVQYEMGMDAPLVVAKGARLIAERIKELAQLHNVPIVENKPLARTLFSSVELGGAIPDYLFTAIAEVLAYVYQLKNKRLYAS